MYPPSPSSLGAHVNETCHTYERTASAATTLTYSQQHTLQCTLPLRVRHVASTRVQAMSVASFHQLTRKHVKSLKS